MATLRALMGAAAIIAGLTFLASPAHACDERYPQTCKSAATTGTSEPAEARKSSNKLLQTTARRRGASAKAANAASERSVQTGRKRHARKATTRRWVARARHAKALAAASATTETARPAGDAPDKAAPDPAEGRRKDPPSRARPSPRLVDGGSEAGPGFASMWKDLTSGATEPFDSATSSQSAAPASDAASGNPVQPPMRVVAQNEPNEIDLAAVATAAAPPGDSFWLRGLFLAFGGLLAIGSALRFLV